MMKGNSTGEVLGKVIPRKRSVFGGLASPARFERAASRLGELQSRMAAKARRCLKKPKKTSNLGKNPVCVLCSFNSLYDSILKQSAVKMQSKCSQSVAAIGDTYIIVG